MTTPGCPEDVEWMAYLEAGPVASNAALTAHLAGCAACRDAVEAARSALAALTNLSPGARRLCPPPEELVEVAAGVATLRVRLHAALCTDCREDLADLASLEAEPPAEVVARWVAEGFRIVTQTLSALAPEPVPLPAAGGTAWRMRHLTDVDVEVRLELAPGDGRSFALSVSLAPAPRPGARGDQEIGERLLESRAMDASGMLSFLALAPGRYRVTVRRPAGAPVVTEIEVG
jgi:hypothetical protein